MRADMFKVVVERPRWGAGHAPSPKLKRTPDPYIQYIGLKRHAYIAAPYSKSLNENLAPLVRFLRSRRGRQWDSVFSEICATLDTGSTIKMHVRSHIEDYVLTRISVGRRGESLASAVPRCREFGARRIRALRVPTCCAGRGR